MELEFRHTNPPATFSRLPRRSCVNAGHGADPPIPSMCWPYEGRSPSRSGSGASAAKSLHSAAKRMHISAYFWMLNTHIAPFLTAGALASLSPRLANDGAGDGVKMGTGGLLSECCFPDLRARSRHHRVPNSAGRVPQ